MDKQDYKISVLGIFSQAAETLENNKAYYLKVLLFPALLMSCLTLSFYASYKLYPNMPQVFGWALSLTVWFSYAIFAATCHRLVLLNYNRGLQPYTLTVTQRELFFCLSLIVIMGIAFLSMWVTSWVILVLLNIFSLSSWTYFVPYLFGLIQTYFLGRLCLVPPSIAIDERISLKQSWVVTRGNSLRILCIIGVVPLFWYLLSLMSTAGSELTFLSIVYDAVFVFLEPVVLAFEVFLVSFVYKDIKENWIASAPE